MIQKMRRENYLYEEKRSKMRYGYFDDEKREYVITRPDTPAPWVNYLGSPEYGAIISNNAGGYSFEKSGANGRILRYVFNQFDEPGRYIYIRDNESKDYWSASWQPVGKDLEEYKSECHHGTAYTRMIAQYAGISSEVLYYVPLDNKGNYNGNGCGALTTELEFAPGETKEVIFIVGMKYDDEAAKIIARYDENENLCEEELVELKKFWHGKLEKFQVKTPSEEFNTMINTWNAYNCFMTFIWSRAASFTYCGLRNGYGYRDTVQDIQGIIHLAPEMAVEKIRFMLSAQVDNGGGLPLVKFTHNPGHEDTPDDASYVQETGHPAYRADDALWLFPTVYKYISETGNMEFLDEVIPFANKDEATVYEHLQRAVKFSAEHLGKHGMPAGLYADWNDCLRLGKDGESSFVAMQYYYAMTILRKFAEYKNDDEYVKQLDKQQEELGRLIQEICYDEDRFIRGFTEEGKVIGKRTDAEANMWLNPQSWAVISKVADEKQGEIIMNSVHDRLNTKYGAILMDPPYHAEAFSGALAVIYNAGTKENSGIFSQSQGWLILAEALLKHGDRAFEYFMENSPAAQNDRAETRVLEPYCYGQFTEGKASPNFGRSHVHWLTGTASTVMVGCVEGILGMRPDFEGLHIEPSVPKEWGEFEITKSFRGSNLHIVIKNPGHIQSGCKKMVVNGIEVEGSYITQDMLTENTEIELMMS